MDEVDDFFGTYREHSKAKHEVVSKYLSAWIKIVQKWKKLRFFDCCAGAGCYLEGVEGFSLQEIKVPNEVKIPGSPLLALDTATMHSQLFEDFYLVLFEKDPNNFKCLTNLLDLIPNIPDNIHLTAKPVPFQESVWEVIEKTGGYNIPTIFFIDPYGFKNLDCNTLRKIAKKRNFEILLTFMSSAMKRWLNSPKHEDAFHNVFCNEEWRGEIEDYSPENWSPLMELYSDYLEEWGFNHTMGFRICEPERMKTLYYLIFGSHHPKGLQVFREVTQRCGTGNFAYAPANPQYHREQRTLSGLLSDKKEVLLDMFEGQRLPFKYIVKEIAKELKYEDYMTKDIRSDLKELEKEGKISIKRITSETEKGLRKSDLVEFPGK